MKSYLIRRELHSYTHISSVPIERRCHNNEDESSHNPDEDGEVADEVLVLQPRQTEHVIAMTLNSVAGHLVSSCEVIYRSRCNDCMACHL